MHHIIHPSHTRSLWGSLGLFLLIVLSGVLSAAEKPTGVSEKEWAAAMNIAGRQRMLSQKMFKELLLAHHGVDVDAQRKQMLATVKLFAESHRRLTAGDSEQGVPAAPTPEVKAALAAIDAPWATFNAELTAAATATTDTAKLGALATTNEQLLSKVAAMVEIYEQAQKTAMGTATGKVINWAGRQRMLSQRMAKEALLIAAGADADAAKGRLAKARELFDRSHRALSQGDAEAGIPAPTEAPILKQFSKIGELWTVYQQLLDAVASGDVAKRKELADASVQILTETNRATTLLESRTR